MVAKPRARRRAWTFPLLLLVALVAVAGAAAAAPAANAPVEVTFVKTAVDGVPGYYAGTTGDGGAIEMWVSNSRVTGSMQHFDVTLRASLSDGRSFTAMLKGTFNFSTARTLLTGVVTEGWLAGAQVRERGALVDDDPLTFEGTLWLMPASA
jgi:hypothetical protein